MRTILDKQLKTLKTKYIDFYMVHAIRPSTVENYRNFDMYNQVMEFKKEGKIKYAGFSFHGSTNMLKEIVAEHPWDFCYLQMNYLDWDYIDAHQQYDVLTKFGIPVIVMEPLKGGNLVRLNEKALNKLKEYDENINPTEFALRWAASKDNVVTVLSGMSNITQIRENTRTFFDFKKTTPEEENLASEVAKILQSNGDIDCTACKYCTEVCPMGINIPMIFSLYNQLIPIKKYRWFYDRYTMLDENQKANKCINCKLCNSHCPQNLDIPKLLKDIDKLCKDVVEGKIK